MVELQTTSPDVIVVGAGVIGCATAFELSRRGASVRIIEARGVGRGATQASAGILAPYVESHGRPSLHRLTVRSLELYDAFMDRVREATGADVLYERRGDLQVASDDASLEALQAAARSLNEQGTSCTWLDADDVRAIEPQLSTDARGGLLVHAHGFVSAMDLTRALAGAVERAGGTVSESRVRRIHRAADHVVVETDTGPLSASTVVMAAGSWAGETAVDGAPPAPVRPVRGQLVELRWNGPPPARVTWGEGCYLVPWTSGAVLVGATVEDVGFDERTTVAGVHGLLDAAASLMPHAWHASVEAVRVGLRPVTPDETPIIGRSAQSAHVVYAVGHYRNGVLLAPLTAGAVADLIVDGREDPDLAAAAPSRFGL